MQIKSAVPWNMLHENPEGDMKWLRKNESFDYSFIYSFNVQLPLHPRQGIGI